jgi:hypothetical protein
LEYRALQAAVNRVSSVRAECIADALSGLFPEVASQISPSLRSNLLFGALLEHVAYQAESAARGEADLARSADLLDTLVKLPDEKRELLVLDSRDCRKISNSDYESAILLATAGAVRKAYPIARSEYTVALNLLRRLGFAETLPQCAAVVIELERKELLEPMNSYTLSGLPGTIFCDFVASEVRLAETLLHESTHTWLNYAFAALQHKGFSSAEYWSPWRHKPRPAYGIVQATLVFSRLCQFFDRCLRCATISEVDRAYCSSRLRVEAQVLRSNLGMLGKALDEVADTALRAVIAEELNRAINLSPQEEGEATWTKAYGSA